MEDLLARLVVAVLGAFLSPSSAAPPGFGSVDAYPTIQAACRDTADREVPERWRNQAFQWCIYRAYHSSRYGQVRSKVDGSQIHDRDRPGASWFYGAAVRKGRLDPEACPAHRLRETPHPGPCWEMAAHWPFRRPAELPEERRRRWFKASHDAERFGARGPIDLNALVAYGTIPGCWAPEALDRNDVAAAVTIRRAVAICERWGCRTEYDIRARWSRAL